MALAVVVLVAWLYGGNVAAPFVSDDLDLNQRVPIETLSHLWTPTGQYEVYRVFYRPLTTTVYWMNAALQALKPVPLHVEQLVLYLGACALFYRLARQILRSPWAASAATLLFAVHPSHVQPVVWSADLADTMMLVWGLGALTSAAAWFSNRRRRDAGWCLLATTAALASKETAVSLAPLMALLAWTLPDKVRPPRSCLWAALPFLGYAAIRLVYTQVQNPNDLAVADYLAAAHVDWHACLYRFGEHVAAVLVAPDQLAMLTAILAGIMLLAGVIWTDRDGRTRKLTLGLWLALSILPTVGGYDVRYAAWPSIPFILLMVDSVSDLQRPTLAVPVTLGFLAFWSLRTAAEANLWHRAAVEFEHIARLQANVQYLALPYALDGRWGLWTFQAYEYSDPIYIHWVSGSVCRFYYDGPPGMAPVDTGDVPALPGGRVRPTWASLLGTDPDPQTLAGPAQGPPWRVLEQYYWRPLVTEPMPGLPHE